MLIYNITYLVSHDIHDEWLTWMKTLHAPEMLSTGHFSGYSILRLKDVDETEGVTYALQFRISDDAHYRQYLTEAAPQLRLKEQQQWGDRVMAFRTLMEIVQ